MSLIVAILLASIIYQTRIKQIGPTCGFYCITWCLFKDSFKASDEAARLVIESHRKGFTNVGEIFDIKVFERIVKEQAFKLKGTNNNIAVINTPSKEYLKSLLETYYIIMPIKGIRNKEITHFIVIRQLVGDYAITYNPQMGKFIFNINKIIDENMNLDYYFNWTYWKENRKPAKYPMPKDKEKIRNKIEAWIRNLNTRKVDYSVNLAKKIVIVPREYRC